MCSQASAEASDLEEDSEMEYDAVPAVAEPAQARRNPSGTHEVMRTKNFFLKAMSVEEAVEQCDQLGHEFYVFRESISDQVQVVYRRRAAGYGVIVPVNEE